MVVLFHQGAYQCPSCAWLQDQKMLAASGRRSRAARRQNTGHQYQASDDDPAKAHADTRSTGGDGGRKVHGGSDEQVQKQILGIKPAPIG